MISKFPFVILVVVYGCTWCYTGLIAADACTFSRIINLTISDDAILSWEPVPEENCVIDYYLLYFYITSQEELILNTTETSMNVSFLPICATVTFIVMPVSPEGVEGSYLVLLSTMPLPPDVNLTITYVRLSPADGGASLEWDVEEAWRGCVRYYRVVVYDEATDSATDIYSSSTSLSIPDLVPCSSYDIGVRALYDLQAEGPITLVKYTTPAVTMSPPTLGSISLGTTSIDMTWNLEEYSKNRCALTYLIIDGSPLFNISYSITDQPHRPPIASRITNLQENTMYVLNVTVFNTGGTSSPMFLAVQTLESN